MVARGQLDPVEHGVADHHGEGPHVAGQWSGGWREVARLRQAGIRVDQVFPLVEQAGVGLAHQLTQPLDDVLELVGAVALGHRVTQRAISVGEVAQQQPLRPRQPVDRDELVEGHALLEHLSHDRLRREGLGRDPGVRLPVGAQGDLEQVGERLGPAHLIKALHAFLVLDAVELHGGDRLATRLRLLRPQHLPGVLEDGLDDRHEILGVGLRLGVEGVHDGQGERREGLVEGEVALEVDGEGVTTARRLGRR